MKKKLFLILPLLFIITGCVPVQNKVAPTFEDVKEQLKNEYSKECLNILEKNKQTELSENKMLAILIIMEGCETRYYLKSLTKKTPKRK